MGRAVLGKMETGDIHMGTTKQATILVADDDADDRMMIKDACDDVGLESDLEFVVDGEELLDYLRGEGAFTHRAGKPFHGIVLLDLNMPKKDGREALREIKADPQLKRIPVVILTTSVADEDISKAYKLGVSSYITKPVTFDGLIDVVRSLKDYWLQIVTIPKDNTVTD